MVTRRGTGLAKLRTAVVSMRDIVKRTAGTSSTAARAKIGSWFRFGSELTGTQPLSETESSKLQFQSFNLNLK